MKKKPIVWIVLVIVIAVIVAGAVWAKQYYEDRYVGTDYYTMIPLDYDMTPETQYSASGEDVGLGKDFNLIAYNEEGEEREISFIMMSEDSADYPQPGTFLLAKVSKQLVVSWNIVEENRVPDRVLTRIKNDQ